jgi:hypothetical protein
VSTGKLDDQGLDRRQFLGRTGATGAGVLFGGSALGALAPSLAAAKKGGAKKGHVKKSDLEILVAAQIAEALAVTTYTNIINAAPFFSRLASDDQGYLKAGSGGRSPSPSTSRPGFPIGSSASGRSARL